MQIIEANEEGKGYRKSRCERTFKIIGLCISYVTDPVQSDVFTLFPYPLQCYCRGDCTVFTLQITEQRHRRVILNSLLKITGPGSHLPHADKLLMLLKH